MSVATKAKPTGTTPAPGKLAWLFKGDNLFGYLMMAPVIGVLIMFFAYPLFYEVYSSFTDRTVGHAGKFIGLKNYIFLFEDPTYIKAAINTLVYVSCVQIGKFILGLGIALLLQQKLFGRGLWRALVLVPYAMPGFVAYMVWKLIYNPDVGALNIFLNQIGLIDTHIAFLSDGNTAMPAVIVATIWRGFPFWTIMFLAALQAVPKELYEAASIDGGNAWHRFRHISLPGIRPVILIVFMLSTVSTINSFEAVWLTTGGGPADATLILPVFAYRGLVQFQIGQSAAAALSLMPVILAFVILILRKLKKD
jgi:multiple sugar transport system permease protein